jgi:hypothetical protein
MKIKFSTSMVSMTLADMVFPASTTQQIQKVNFRDLIHLWSNLKCPDLSFDPHGD